MAVRSLELVTVYDDWRPLFRNMATLTISNPVFMFLVSYYPSWIFCKIIEKAEREQRAVLLILLLIVLKTCTEMMMMEISSKIFWNECITQTTRQLVRPCVMDPNEPTLLTHINELRSKTYLEGIGLSNVIFAGKLLSELDVSEGLLVHRKIVEEEVNSSEANITGILMGQVTIRYPFYVFISSLHELKFINHNRGTAYCISLKGRVDQF